MFHDSAEAISLILGGASLGWVLLFSFVAAPTAYKIFDGGRADRVVKETIKAGHGVLAGVILLAALAGLFSGSIAGAVVYGVAAIFTLCCQWALAPRTDKPIIGHKVYKTARIVASALTASVLPIVIAAIVLTMMGI
jgi:hypothetical protein